MPNSNAHKTPARQMVILMFEAKCDNALCNFSKLQDDEWNAEQVADEHHAETGHDLTVAEVEQ